MYGFNSNSHPRLFLPMLRLSKYIIGLKPSNMYALFGAVDVFLMKAFNYILQTSSPIARVISDP